MSSMVERVARAIMSDLSERSGVIDGIDEDILAEMGDTLARAAIRAMREPTDAMIVAGQWPAEDDGSAACWLAMIDAALNEEGQG